MFSPPDRLWNTKIDNSVVTHRKIVKPMQQKLQVHWGEWGYRSLKARIQGRPPCWGDDLTRRGRWDPQLFGSFHTGDRVTGDLPAATRAQQAAMVYLSCRSEDRTAEPHSCVSCQVSASIAIRSEISDTEQCTMHSVRRRPVLRFFFCMNTPRGGGESLAEGMWRDVRSVRYIWNGQKKCEW